MHTRHALLLVLCIHEEDLLLVLEEEQFLLQEQELLHVPGDYLLLAQQE